MIMIVKTPGSQMGSPAAAEEGGEEVGGGRGESGERSEVQARSTLTSTLPKVITALARTSACPGTTVAFARTLASPLTPSKPEEGRRAEGLEEAL